MATLNDIVNETAFQTSVSIQAAFTQAVRQGVAQGTSEALRAMGKALTNVAPARPLFQAANEKLALSMQDAVLRSYDQVVTARKHFDSYRVDEPSPKGEYAFGRFSGGKLRHALQAEDMVVASPQGIAFINEERLDEEAAHWYRLNYGAGSGAGKAADVVPFRFAGQTLGVLALDGPPSAPFRMPFGIWSNGEGGLPPGFYPRSKKLNIVTNGIQARRFLDAGLRRFAAEAPIVYEDLLIQFVDQAMHSASGPLYNTKVEARAVLRDLGI